MAIIFGSVQIFRFIDIANPRNVLLLRMAYLSSQMLMLGFWYFMRTVVLKHPKASEEFEYEEPAAPFSGAEPKKIKTTFSQYDAIEVGKQLQQIVVGTIIMFVIHYWFGIVQPLFLQIIIPWKSVIAQPLVQIHLFGFPSTGALKRPFKQPNPFSEFAQEQTAEPATEGEVGGGGGEEEKKPETMTLKKKKGGRKED